MFVTTVDFHANMDKYLALIPHEDIFLTVEGKPVAHMVAPKMSAVDHLYGLLKNAPAETTATDIREERLQRHEHPKQKNLRQSKGLFYHDFP